MNPPSQLRFSECRGLKTPAWPGTLFPIALAGVRQIPSNIVTSLAGAGEGGLWIGLENISRGLYNPAATFTFELPVQRKDRKL